MSYFSDLIAFVRRRPCRQLQHTAASLLFIALLMPVSVWAQQATLQGTVTDAATGAPLSGVNVSIPSLERGAVTQPDGTYRITNVPAKTPLTVRFGFVGYETQVRQVTLAAGATHALDVALPKSMLQGQEVTVTGTPTAQDVLTSTQDVSVVSPEALEVERTAALGDLLEETVPGAASIKTGPQAGKPVLRGLTGNRVRMLVDGIAQEYYQFGVRHFPNTSLSEAGRIEVVRGPASLLYGSDALGGAINILPKSFPDEGVGGRASGQYFSNNNERAATFDVHGRREGVGTRVGLERRVAGNFTTPDAPTFFETQKGGRFGDPKYSGEIPFTNFEQWTGYGQLGWKGRLGSVQLLGDYWQNRQNFILPSGGPKDDDPNNAPVVGVGQHLEHANVALKGNLLLADFVVQPRLSFQRALRQSAGAGNTLAEVDEAEDNGGFSWPVDLTKDVYTGRLEVLHPAAYGLSGTLGAEAVYRDGQSRGPVPLEPSAQVLGLAVFAFEEYDAGGPLTLSGGARLDYRTHDADPPQGTRDALELSSDDLEKRYTTLSGSVGANYRLADGWAAVVNLGTGFRAPSIFELYANGQHGGVAAFQRGNPELKPERTYSVDLGVRARTGRLTGVIIGYYTYFTNYIYLRNTGASLNSDGSGPPVYTSGETTASIRGVEASAQVAVLPWMTMGAEAVFLGSKGDDLEANADGDPALPLIPADRLSGNVRLEPRGFGLLRRPFVQAKVRHVFSKGAAGRYEPFSQFDGAFGPPFGTASTKAYTLVNLSAGATLELGDVAPALSIGVKNALNETYRDFLDTYKGYALSPGRNIYVKASVPF